MSDHSTNPQAFFAHPGPLTDPRRHAHLFAGLPADIPGLCRVVQGLLLHIFWAERYGVQLSDKRKQEVEIRPVDRKLDCLLSLDDRPLSVARPPERRLVGNCRDFALLLTAFLRHQAVPARARCGFGAYFMPGHFEDHWVSEYWNAAEQRWTLVDPQLDAIQSQTLKIAFDPLDVPRDQFIVAGQGWQMCRLGLAEPEAFGIFDMHGWWFIRGNVVRDVLALNKVELLPWDGGWGLLAGLPDEAALPGSQAGLFDQLAALSLAGDDVFAQLHALYLADERLHIPPELLAWSGEV